VPQHLRALLYDPTHGSQNELVNQIMTSFEQSIGICVISMAQPRVMIDKAIVSADPSEVLDLATGEETKRKLAIVETPDLAAVVLTSGTTSNPKPVELTFTGLRSSTESLYRCCGLSSDDSWLCTLPPNYVAGLAIFGRCFVSGSNLVFNSQFNVDSFFESVLEHNITVTSLVPQQLEELLESGKNFGPLKKILIGGTKVDQKLENECINRGVEIFATYGMTETWGGICINGEFLDNTSGRIVNDEIQLLSDSIMAGYRHDSILTKSKFSTDGWFKTGDIGTINDNTLEVIGRLDEIINSGGIKVDPKNIEEIIARKFPELNFGICSTQHPKLGESVTFCIEKRQLEEIDLKTLRSVLKELLPSTQLPTRLATIEKIPLTQSGKIKRKELANLCEVISDYLADIKGAAN